MAATQDIRTGGAEQRTPAAPDLVATSHEMLELVVTMAVIAAPSSTAASVSLAGGPGGDPSTAVASRQLARDLDEVQHRSGRGPCADAARAGQEARCILPSADLPELSRAAAPRGIRSAWSIPLTRSGRTAGTLNIYSSADPPWRQPSAATTKVLAAVADLAICNATSTAQLVRGNATLREALETRTVIGQAQGVLMARQGIQAPEAFDILRRASQRTNRKLRDLAIEIVAGVGTPAEARRSTGDRACSE